MLCIILKIILKFFSPASFLFSFFFLIFFHNCVDALFLAKIFYHLFVCFHFHFFFLFFFWTQIDMSNVLIYIKFWAKKIFIASTNSFHLKLNRAVEDFFYFVSFWFFVFLLKNINWFHFTKKLKHFFISFWIIVRNYLITI